MSKLSLHLDESVGCCGNTVRVSLDGTLSRLLWLRVSQLGNKTQVLKPPLRPHGHISFSRQKNGGLYFGLVCSKFSKWWGDGLFKELRCKWINCRLINSQAELHYKTLKVCSLVRVVCDPAGWMALSFFAPRLLSESIDDYISLVRCCHGIAKATPAEAPVAGTAVTLVWTKRWFTAGLLYVWAWPGTSLILSCMPLACSFVRPTSLFISAQYNGSKTIVYMISLMLLSAWMQCLNRRSFTVIDTL